MYLILLYVDGFDKEFTNISSLNTIFTLKLSLNWISPANLGKPSKYLEIKVINFQPRP